MKQKFIIAVAAIALIASPVFSQESGLGAKGGLNFANMSGDVEKTSMRTSIHLGGYYNHMLSDVFAIQAELVYSGQGYKQTDDSLKGTAKINYINLPFMAKYYVTEEINIHGGLQIGILAGANYELDGKSASISDVSGIDLSLGIGGGYELESGLNFGLRYNLGLSNAYSGAGDFTYKHGVLQLSVGYRFTEALF